MTDDRCGTCGQGLASWAEIVARADRLTSPNYPVPMQWATAIGAAARLRDALIDVSATAAGQAGTLDEVRRFASLGLHSPAAALQCCELILLAVDPQPS